MMSSDQTADSNTNSSKDGGSVAVPEQALCPYIEDKEASIKTMLKDNYGLTVTSLKALNGYDDLNYHVKTESTYCNPNIDTYHPEGFFLKISNLKDSRCPEMLHAQRSIMDHLIGKGIVCQDAVRGVNGETFTEITSSTKTGETVTYAVSLRTFLQGKVIAGSTLTAELLCSLGVFVAKVTDALQDFSHPFYETFDLLWNLSNLSKVSEVMFAVKDEKMRKISEEVIKSFETQVMPNKHTLRKCQIHGDLNEHNILINSDYAAGTVPHVTGLLDFQDSANSYPVYDIAMFISYMLMTGNTDVPQNDIPGYVMAGYISITDLPSAEKNVLRVCIAARMVMSLVYGAYTYHLDPSNEYVLDTAKFGWQALSQFWEADAQKMQDRWYEIAKTYSAK